MPDPEFVHYAPRRSAPEASTEVQVVGQDADVAIADGGNSITIDGTVTETNSAAILADTANMDTNLGTLAGAVSGSEMQVDIVAEGAGLATAANQLPDGHNVTIDNATGASAVNIQDGGNSITVDGTVSVTDGLNIEGDVSHDSADSGNPVKVGLKAIDHGTNPTEVASADRTDWYANNAGIPFVIPGHPNVVTFRATYTASQSNTAIVSTSEKIVVTRVSATCDNANTNDTQCRIGFGTASTPTTTGVLLSHPGIAAGSGVVEGSGAGMLGVGAAGEDIRITCEDPGGTIDVVVTYYEISA